MDFIFPIRNYYKQKEDIRNICFYRQMTNSKLLKENRLLANVLSDYSFKVTLTFVLII